MTLAPGIKVSEVSERALWYRQRARAVWCLSSKNRLECFVKVIKSQQDFNSLTFPFLAGTKLNLHGVNR